MFCVAPSRNLSGTNLFSMYSTGTLRLYSMNIVLKKYSDCQRNRVWLKKMEERLAFFFLLLISPSMFVRILN